MQIECPRCKQLTHWTDNPSRPFCSERCKLIDLGAWANDEYRIETEESIVASPKSEDDYED